MDLYVGKHVYWTDYGLFGHRVRSGRVVSVGDSNKLVAIAGGAGRIFFIYLNRLRESA